MNKKILYLSLLLLLSLLCCACSLAQPELEGTSTKQDRFIGVYIISDEEDSRLYESDAWVTPEAEYTDLDSFLSAQQDLILPAVYSREEHTYIFPDLDGYALFAAMRTDEGEENSYTFTCCDLSKGNSGFHTVATEEGEAYTNYELSGTLYVTDAHSETGYYRLLNVYQKPDGTVYLNGTGDSFGSGGTITLEEKQTETVHGKETELATTKVTVSIEEAKEADRGILYWYKEDGTLLATEAPDLDQLTELLWPDKGSWLVFEEHFPEEVRRTLVERKSEEESDVLHIMTINSKGIGELKEVPIKSQ
jgi:hypothetical protein